VAIVKDFASRFIQLEFQNARLQRAAQSSSDKLDQAVKLAATARQEAEKLKKELNQLKMKLEEDKKEKVEKVEAQAQAMEKEDNLRNSIKALLGNLLQQPRPSFPLESC
jgi:ATPase subunit of ABC transporter with duplicated ATPase domains